MIRLLPVKLTQQMEQTSSSKKSSVSNPCKDLNQVLPLFNVPILIQYVKEDVGTGHEHLQIVIGIHFLPHRLLYPLQLRRFHPLLPHLQVAILRRCLLQNNRNMTLVQSV